MKKIRNIADVHSAEKVGFVSFSPLSPMTNVHFPITQRGYEVLVRAAACYNSFAEIRKRRKRSRKYYRGEQWSDTIEHNGKTMTEEQYIQLQGKPALKQNLIRPPVRNIISQFRNNPFKSVIYARNKDNKKAAEMMSVAYESAYEMNKGKERDARQMEEFLLSGFPIYEVSYSYDILRKRSIPKFRAVNPTRFFTNPDVSDVCGDDVNIVGEIIDLPLSNIISAYAKNEEQEAELKRIFGGHHPTNMETQALSSYNIDSLSFSAPCSRDTRRVIKVCVLESRWVIDAHDYADGTRKIYDYSRMGEIDAENAARLKLQHEHNIAIPLIKYKKRYIHEWVYYHLSPYGHVLFRKTNPYHHRSHPYVFKMYPLLDGEVWSLVEDLIDQQRAINRMIILQDFIISAAAKGVLLVPEESIPDDMDIEDIAEEWTKYNGVIKIRARAGMEMPKQILASNFNIPITDAINYQIKWIQDIGGVQDAAMGIKPTSGTSAARYKLETANSSLNALDYIESFGAMLIDRDWKLVQVIKQFYTEKQYIALAGDDYSEEAKHYDPDVIADIDFDNTMAKMDDTITMRFISEDSLFQLLQMRLITLKQYLQNSETMYSDKLLALVEEQEQAAANRTLNPADLQNVMQQVQEQTPQPTGLAQSKALLNGSVI